MALKEYILSIDLGTTLIKCIIYDSNLKRINDCSIKFDLDVDNKFVEFNIDEYWDCLKKNLKKMIDESNINVKHIIALGLSGQSESFVLLDRHNKPLRKAVSWLDQRSEEEVDEIRGIFKEQKSYKITGQTKVITTWTATKLLWIKKHELGIFDKIKKILLLKDYIAFKFTGLFLSEYTTHNYSYYFDIYKKCYWEDMLNYIGVKINQLPELVEPGKNIGKLTSENTKYFNFGEDVFLNIGANDQFAGMIGVGNIAEGIISESTGTVLTIAMMVGLDNLGKVNLPVHYNTIKNTYVYLMTCESGGVCLEWLKNSFFKDKKYWELDASAEKIEKGSKGLIFLPNIVGANSPEYDLNTVGGFLNLKIFHNEIFFIRAVMEGLGFLIKKNLSFLEDNDIKIKNIISLGGGSKSDIWNKIKSDITGKKVTIMSEDDPVGLGIAILVGLELGFYNSLEQAVKEVVKIKKEYFPEKSEHYELNYKKFIDYYNCLNSS